MRANLNTDLDKDDHGRDHKNLNFKENSGLISDKDLPKREDVAIMDNVSHRSEDGGQNDVKGSKSEDEDDVRGEDVGPDTPRPSYREDRSENMDCDHVASDDEDEGMVLVISDEENGDVEELRVYKRDSRRMRRRTEELLAVYENEGEWEDEDDDKDWEPRTVLQLQLRWFCTNCNMPNFDDSLHCGICGEHQQSGILKSGFLSHGDLPMEVHNETDLEREQNMQEEGEGRLSVCPPSILTPLSLLPISSSTLPGRLTAIGYDERMLLHSEVQMKSYPHPERPDRLRSILSGLEAAGLFQRCFAIPTREASRAELEAVHTKEHVDAVEATSNSVSSYFTSDTYANQSSALAARLAAGICADLATLIMKGHAQNGFALVRPPGHHAERSNIMGFCLLNNAAIAAKAALEVGAKKVLILDWDVHHGNGTQEIFEYDPSVLYISLHRHEGGHFYPGTGSACEVGSAEGEGFSVNIPWVCAGIGDGDYIFAFQHIVMPIAMQFAPDMVIISAGFDAAQGDPLGGCEVTPIGYAHMAQLLTSLGQKKVLVILEGGYNLRSISASVAAVVKVLLGESPEPILDVRPTRAGLTTVLEVCHVQGKYWQGLHIPIFKMPHFGVANYKQKGKVGRKQITGGPLWWKWGRKRIVYEHWFGNMQLFLKH
eukprot:c27426_g1_i2 orf=1077-3047(-)